MSTVHPCHLSNPNPTLPKQRAVSLPLLLGRRIRTAPGTACCTIDTAACAAAMLPGRLGLQLRRALALLGHCWEEEEGGGDTPPQLTGRSRVDGPRAAAQAHAFIFHHHHISSLSIVALWLMVDCSFARC